MNQMNVEGADWSVLPRSVSRRRMASWNCLLLVAAIGAAAAPLVAVAGAPGIELTVTATESDPSHPDACDGSATLDVVPGEQVNVCYRVTNSSTTTLQYQTLSDTLYGNQNAPIYPVFRQRSLTIAPGATVQYNRVVSVGSMSQNATATWAAADALPDYTATATGGDPDRLFRDGFDGDADSGFIDISGYGYQFNLPHYNSIDSAALPDFPLTLYGMQTDSFDDEFPEDILCVANAGAIFVLHFEYGGALTHEGNGAPGCVGSPTYGQFLGVSEPLPTDVNPVPGATRYMLFPFWDELGEDGNVYMATVGSAPDRRIVVQWDRKNHAGDPGGGGISFEAIFREGDPAIDFVYRDTVFGGASEAFDHGTRATVGLQSLLDSNSASQFSFHEATLDDGMTIHFVPVVPTSYTDQATLNLHVVAPDVVTSPSAEEGFDQTLAAGASASSTLLIDNVGDAELRWTLAEAPAELHFPRKPAHALAQSDTALDLRDTASAAQELMPAAAQLAPAPFGDAAIPAPFYLFDFQNLGSDDAPDLVFVFSSVTSEEMPISLNPIATFPSGLLGYAGASPKAAFIGDDFSKVYTVIGSAAVTDLATIDTATGQLTDVLPLNLAVQSLKWDPITGQTYALVLYSPLDNGPCFQPGIPQDRQDSQLGTINASNGTSQFVGDMLGVCMDDIAFDRDGLLYGIDHFQNMLYAIDKYTAQVAPIGPLGITAAFGAHMDFDRATNTLYALLLDVDVGAPALYQIDTLSGAASLVAPIATHPDSTKDGLAIAKADDSPCTMPADVPWLTLDQTSGTTAPDPGQNAPSTVNVGFDASDLAPGDYSARLCLFSNDPDDRRVELPVHLTVQ